MRYPETFNSLQIAIYWEAAGKYSALMKLADFPGVHELSVQEKLQLMDELWFSVAPELELRAASDEEKSKLDARWTEFIKNPASAVTLEQFQEKMRKHRR